MMPNERPILVDLRVKFEKLDVELAGPNEDRLTVSRNRPTSEHTIVAPLADLDYRNYMM